MTGSDFLGRREGPELEFKSSRSLEDLPSLAREVVAFLNAGGGQIVVGVEEEEGRAAHVQGVEDAPYWCRRIEDHLVDTIEPAPEGSLVEVEPDRGLIRIRVASGPHKPYARIRRSERLYVIRAGARIRPMTRDEIRDAMRGSNAADANARKSLDAAREEYLRDGPSGMWIGFEPETPMEVDLEEITPLLSDPGASGCRRNGFNVMSPSRRIERFSDRVEQRLGVVARLEVHESGALRYRTALDQLRHGVRPDEWNPYALIELPTSLIRLASKIAGMTRPADVLAQLVLAGSAGVCLPAFPPGTWGYQMGRVPDWPDDWLRMKEDVVTTTVVRIRGEDLLDSPDRCAWRLWSQVYDAFGYPVRLHPAAYDAAAGRLVIAS
jgi:hypothetical protein